MNRTTFEYNGKQYPIIEDVLIDNYSIDVATTELWHDIAELVYCGNDEEIEIDNHFGFYIEDNMLDLTDKEIQDFVQSQYDEIKYEPK